MKTTILLLLAVCCAVPARALDPERFEGLSTSRILSDAKKARRAEEAAKPCADRKSARCRAELERVSSELIAALDALRDVAAYPPESPCAGPLACSAASFTFDDRLVDKDRLDREIGLEVGKIRHLIMTADPEQIEWLAKDGGWTLSTYTYCGFSELATRRVCSSDIIPPGARVHRIETLESPARTVKEGAAAAIDALFPRRTFWQSLFGR